MPQGNRRIDKVLDPEFVEGLRQISLDELRGRRKEAEQEETDLSYMRRLLQGRLDILRAELARREDDRAVGSEGDDVTAVAALDEAVADDLDDEWCGHASVGSRSLGSASPSR